MTDRDDDDTTGAAGTGPRNSGSAGSGHPPAWRADWDQRARQAMRLAVATWYARDDATWAEGIRRDAAVLLDSLPEGLGPGRACLDLGCGPGRLMPALAGRFDRVVGCDVSAAMLEHARAELGDDPRFELVLTAGPTLDGLDSDAFAFVLANAVFIHVDADTARSLLREAARVLAPDGVFAATFSATELPAPAPDSATPASEDEARQAVRPVAIAPPEPSPEQLDQLHGATWDGARWSAEQLTAALADAGLWPYRMDAVGPVYYVMARNC